MNGQQDDKKFYYMKTHKRVSKNGKVYHTGNFAYAVDLVGFEKEDGTITWWLSPKDMDKMKQQQEARGVNPSYVQKQQSPRPQPTKQPYVDHTKNNYAPQVSEVPWPEQDDEIPF